MPSAFEVYQHPRGEVQKSAIITKDGWSTLSVPWEDIPDLITKLRRAYNEHAANTPTP